MAGQWAAAPGGGNTMTFSQKGGCHWHSFTGRLGTSSVTGNGSYVGEWNLEMQVVVAGGASAAISGHLNGCDPSSCRAGDTIRWAAGPAPLGGSTWTMR